MSSAGLIDIGMRVTTTGLTKGLSQGQKMLSAFGGSLSSAASAASAGMGGLNNALTSTTGLIAGLAGAAGIGLGVSALKDLVAAQLDLLGSLGEVSDRLGIMPARYKGLEYGAMLSGVSSEKFSDSMDRLNRILGDAKSQTGSARDSMLKFGVSAKELANLTTEQALRKIANTIAATTDPALKASLAYEVFGRSANQMVAYLNGGAEGIDAFMQEAERLGATFSRIDVAKAEMAGDSIDKLKFAFEQLTTHLTIELSPILIGVSESMLEFGTSGTKTASLVTASLESVSGAVGFVMDSVHLMKLIFKGFAWVSARAVVGVIQGFNWLAQSIREVANLLGADIGKDNFIQKITDDALAAVNAMQSELRSDALDKTPSEKLNAWLISVKRNANEAAAAIANTPESPINIDVEKMESARKKIEELTKSLEQVGKTDGEKIGLEIDKLDKQIGDLKWSFIDGDLTESQMQTAVAAIQTVRDQMSKMQTLTETLKIKEFSHDLKESIKTFSEKMNDEIFKINEALIDGSITEDEAGKAKDKVRSDFGFGTEFEKSRDKILEMRKLLEQGIITPVQFETASFEALPSKVKSMIEDVKTPMQKMEAQVAELEKARGLVSDSLIDQAIDKVKFGDTSETKLAAANDISSKEAQEAIIRQQFSNKGKDPITDVEKNTRQQIVQQRKTNRLLARQNREESWSLPA